MALSRLAGRRISTWRVEFPTFWSQLSAPPKSRLKAASAHWCCDFTQPTPHHSPRPWNILYGCGARSVLTSPLTKSGETLPDMFPCSALRRGPGGKPSKCTDQARGIVLPSCATFHPGPRGSASPRTCPLYQSTKRQQHHLNARKTTPSSVPEAERNTTGLGSQKRRKLANQGRRKHRVQLNPECGGFEGGAVQTQGGRPPPPHWRGTGAACRTHPSIALPRPARPGSGSHVAARRPSALPGVSSRKKIFFLFFYASGSGRYTVPDCRAGECSRESRFGIWLSKCDGNDRI